jgi:uncharacterized protein (DUF58 family)
LLTGTGRAVAVATVMFGLAGWWLAYPHLTALALAGLLVMASAGMWVTSRPRLDIDRKLVPDRIPRGGSAVAQLVVANRGRRATPSLPASEPVGSTDVELDVPRVKAGGEREISYPLPTDRRGVFTVGPLAIERFDPFGVLRVARHYGTPDTFWVHPAVHPLTLLPGMRSRHLDGPSADTAPDGTITFHTLRDYEMGDDLRHIHWRSSARLGTLMVRQHVDTSRPDTTVVLDTRPGPYGDDPARFEEAVDAAASLVSAATAQGFPVRLLTSGGVSLGEQAPLTDPVGVLDRLAEIDLTPGADMDGLLDRMGARRGGGVLAVLTGNAEIGTVHRLGHLRRRFEHTVLVQFVAEGRAAEPVASGVQALAVRTAREMAELWSRGSGR